MKKQHFVLLMLVLMGMNVIASDIIITNKAEKLVVKIEEVGKNEVRYRKMNNLKGPIFVLNTNEIRAIMYENGDVQAMENEVGMSQPQPQPQPQTQPQPQPQPQTQLTGNSPAKLVAKTIAFSDTVEVLFITNVPANLKLNGVDCGEVSTRPYRLKYGEYVAEFRADGYLMHKMVITPSRTTQSIYDITLYREQVDDPIIIQRIQMVCKSYAHYIEEAYLMAQQYAYQTGKVDKFEKIKSFILSSKFEGYHISLKNSLVHEASVKPLDGRVCYKTFRLYTGG